MPGAILPNQRSEANVHILAGYVFPLVFYKMSDRGVPEVICAQKHTTTCVSRHNSRWLLDFSPQKNPINARALSLGPKLSLFSEVSYCRIALTSQRLTRSVTNKGLTVLLQPAILKSVSGFSYEIF